MYIDNLKRQHKDVLKIVSDIKYLLNDVENNASKISLNINILAGKLRVHFQSEDKFLYPTLINSDINKVRDTAKLFIDELVCVSTTFDIYKNKFNTKTKIMSNIKLFLEETNNIIKALNDRIKREEQELYSLIS